MIEPYSGRGVTKILEKHGYAANPDGLISYFEKDENDSHEWIDINADAVRNGDTIPDYPIRILYKKSTDEMGHKRLTVESVKELTAADTSKALKRQSDKKISPWPKSNLSV